MMLIQLLILGLPSLIQAQLDANNSTSADIIVVGAGVAGLGAARALHDAGESVIVLEAKDYVGGRIRSVPMGDIILDKGAMWLDGTEDNPIAWCADLFSAPYVGYDLWLFGEGDSSDVVAYDAVTNKRFEMSVIYENIFDFADSLKKLRKSAGKDASVAEGIELYVKNNKLVGKDARLARYALDQILVEGFYAGTSKTMSLDFIWEDEDLDGGSHVFPGGYSAITDGLASTLDIRLSTIVSSVEYNNDGVIVQTSDGEEYVGKKVIITVPLGVLKANDIEFEPPLPTKITRAIDRLGFGIHEKVVLTFNEKFWPGVGSLYATEEILGIYLTFSDFTSVYGTPTLVAFTGNSAANATLPSFTDSQIVDACIKELETMLGIAVPEPTHFFVSRWMEDPFTKGGYSYIAVGSSPEDMDRFARPIGNSLYFAGEATISKFYSQTHGALISGLRTALLINKKASFENIVAYYNEPRRNLRGYDIFDS